MAREARYDWRHGITKAKVLRIDDTPPPTDVPLSAAHQGVLIRGESYRRLSLTIRKLLETRKKVVVADGWNEYAQRWANEHCVCDSTRGNNDQ